MRMGVREGGGGLIVVVGGGGGGVGFGVGVEVALGVRVFLPLSRTRWKRVARCIQGGWREWAGW